MPLLTNSRKHEDDYYCVAKLTAEDSQYYNTISAPNVSPHVPPPPYRLYLWGTASVSFRMSRCEHL